MDLVFSWSKEEDLKCHFDHSHFFFLLLETFFKGIYCEIVKRKSVLFAIMKPNHSFDGAFNPSVQQFNSPGWAMEQKESFSFTS